MAKAKKTSFPYTQELVMLFVLFCVSVAFAVAILVSRNIDKVTPEEEEDAPVTVTSFDLLVMESFPVEAKIKVTGSQSDSCVGSYTLEEDINGFDIDLSIKRSRQTIECIEKTTPFQETFDIDINGLEKGEYNVNLGGITKKLILSVDNTVLLYDEGLALDLYPLEEGDMFNGHIYYPKVPSFLLEYKNEIQEKSVLGTNTAGYYFADNIENVGFGLFYLPTGALVLSGEGEYEIFYDKYSKLFITKETDNDTTITKYYLLSSKGTKPELVTEIKK